MSKEQEYMTNRTTVTMPEDLRDKLKKLKSRKGEKLENVIKRLIETIEKYNLEIITEEILSN